MAKPLSIEQVISASVRRRGLQFCSPFLYWLEQRPQESGRGVIVRCDPKTKRCEDVTLPGFSVRSKVYEYGGGDYLATADGIFFVNASDQQIYCQQQQTTFAITSIEKHGDARYADFTYCHQSRLLFCVRERHGDSVINDIVCFDSFGQVKIIANGADFYAAPRVSPNGDKICWLQWSLPDMPWDNSELREATLTSAADLCNIRTVVSDSQIAVLAPIYDADNQLWFVDDRDGYWRVKNASQLANNYSPENCDCGVAAWSLAQQPFCVTGGHNVAALVFDQGEQKLILNNRLMPWQFAECMPQILYDGGCFYFFASQNNGGEQLYQVDQDGQINKIVSAEHVTDAIKAEVISVDGVYANFYQAPSSSDSALIVYCHSGPTGFASTALNLVYQFFLQNGFSILDINYRGSYGYGRDYRQALLGQWGVLDVQDCSTVLRFVLANKSLDRRRIYLRGNSAGGLTALHLLAQAPELFSAAALRYPVVDLVQLQAVSHKFEQGYLGQLVGCEHSNDPRWQERSPDHVLHRIKTPLLLMQGDHDPVVPKVQAEKLAVELHQCGIDHRLIVLNNEGHGFRRDDSLIACLKAELDWFNQHR